MPEHVARSNPGRAGVADPLCACGSWMQISFRQTVGVVALQLNTCFWMRLERFLQHVLVNATHSLDEAAPQSHTITAIVTSFS
eukprot:4482935-Amphidinium_carterae.1